jgi:hypothetical protein
LTPPGMSCLARAKMAWLRWRDMRLSVVDVVVRVWNVQLAVVESADPVRDAGQAACFRG